MLSSLVSIDIFYLLNPWEKKWFFFICFEILFVTWVIVINESQVTAGNTFMTSGTFSYYTFWKWWTFSLNFTCWQKSTQILKNYVCVLSCVCVFIHVWMSMEVRMGIDYPGAWLIHRIKLQNLGFGEVLMPSREFLTAEQFVQPQNS